MKEQGLLSGMLKMSIYPSSGDMDLYVPDLTISMNIYTLGDLRIKPELHYYFFFII